MQTHAIYFNKADNMHLKQPFLDSRTMIILIIITTTIITIIIMVVVVIIITGVPAN